MKDLPKYLIILGAVALVLGILSSLSFTMGSGMVIVIKAINYWRGAIALFLLAIALLQLKK